LVINIWPNVWLYLNEYIRHIVTVFKIRFVLKCQKLQSVSQPKKKLRYQVYCYGNRSSNSFQRAAYIPHLIGFIPLNFYLCCRAYTVRPRIYYRRQTHSSLKNMWPHIFTVPSHILVCTDFLRVHRATPMWSTAAVSGGPGIRVRGVVERYILFVCNVCNCSRS